MDLREMVYRSRRLRLQLGEFQAKAEETQRELDTLNRELRRALEDTGTAVAELSEEEFQGLLAEYTTPDRVSVAVAYATRDSQLVKEIELSQGATIEDAIMVSGILERFPEIQLDRCKVGIHGAVKPLTHAVREDDRVEIYRPVEASPE